VVIFLSLKPYEGDEGITMSHEIKIVGIVGAGFMGAQIAARSAIYGYRVHLFDSNHDVLTSARDITKFYINGHFQENERDAADSLGRMEYYDDLARCVKDADLIIEAVTENVDVKKKVFSEIEKCAPPHAIIATNSSSLPVSRMEDAIERKERLANIHFYQFPQRYFVDIMKGTETTDEVFSRVEEWVRSIECLPLIAKKETLGFVFNRVWRAVKKDALKVWAEGYADFRDVDRAWMIFTGMPAGPFGVMDFIGLDVVYNVEMSYFEESKDPDDKPPQALKDMVDRGELGMKTGSGFYRGWPTPEFSDPDFLSPRKKK
jgi:3-hydroxybutyryl-CoA dehydrogenase